MSALTIVLVVGWSITTGLLVHFTPSPETRLAIFFVGTLVGFGIGFWRGMVD